jgi:cell division protein FtsN
MAYDFSLDRKSAVVLSAGMSVILVLVFAAGVLTGISWRAEEDYIAAERQRKSTPAVKPVVIPVPTRQEKPETPAPPQPAALPVQAAIPPAAEPPKPVAAAAPPAGDSPAVRSTPGSDVQLAVQVGAFLDKANAEKLAERLKEEGYQPQIVLAGHAPRSWSIVRVGPYHDWDQASEIAAVLSRDQASPAVVRPMR